MSINIAIDGPAGAGKSTIARRAAAELGFIYVDTGALYRSVAYHCISNGVDINAPEQVEDVSDRIRTPEVSMGASKVSAIPAVRAFLFDLQKKIARENNIIMDGRDIGTVVLPEAEVKVFLTATPEERARRRFLELQQRGTPETFEKVLADIQERDWNDSHRATAPLKQADDAVLLDTTKLTFQESEEALLEIIRGKTGL